MTAHLTEDEKHVLNDLADVAGGLARITGTGHRPDLTEMIHHVHILQAFVMSQAAARAYPDHFRLLGHAAPLGSVVAGQAP